jgi:hypothetical protein
MLEAKTHYEQVPLDIVRKIVEEQILREAAIRQGQGTKNRKLEEDLLEGQEESMPGPCTISELE